MDPKYNNHRQTILRMLPLMFVLISACQGEVPTADVLPVEPEPVEVMDSVDETNTAVAELILSGEAFYMTETAAAERWATETAIVAGTETAMMWPTDTPTPEAPSVSSVYQDALDDCSLSDGQPSDCLGLDIEGVVIGLIQNDDDLIIFNSEAGGAGFVLPEMPIAIPFPFFIAGVRIQDFDPDVSFICINWTDQQTAIPPSDPIANVLATCYNPRHEFLYVNNIDASGQQGVDADPDGTIVFSDPGTGITFVQERRRIFEENSPPSIDLLVVANDQPRLDVLSFEPEGLWTD